MSEHAFCSEETEERGVPSKPIEEGVPNSHVEASGAATDHGQP